MPQEKLEALRRLLESYGSCLVAYSGGVDSVFLAKVAHEVLGDRALAVIADSPSLARRELAEAVAIAGQFGFPLRVVRTAEFENPQYLANPADRCFFCKQELFTVLAPLAREGGFAVLAYGENASDLASDRPGSRAAADFAVRSPLREAGLAKADIRALSAILGLPTADKPQMACLSSRLPTGEAVTPEKLAMVEQAENLLRDLGFRDVRVRHHSLPQALPGPAPARGPALARIEVGPTEMTALLAGDTHARVNHALRDLGYLHVTLDLRPYHRPEAP